MAGRGRKRGWIRQLPSGLWAATIHTPAGRITESFDLMTIAQNWAEEELAKVRRGDWIDPRGGKITVGQVWEKYGDSRDLQLASRKRDASHWRCHVQKRWAKIPIGDVLHPDVTDWVLAMKRRGVGPTTIEGSLGVLRSVMQLAKDAKLIGYNVVQNIKAPTRNAHLDRVLVPEEDDLLLGAADRLFPGRPDARLALELMLYCGLRWEEMGGLDRGHVVVVRGQALVKVGPVLERDGTIRPFPKSPAGVRDVAVDDEFWSRLRPYLLTLDRGQLLVTSPAGKPLDYSRWHDRVWSVILAGKAAYPGRRGHPAREAIAGAGLDDPPPTPHDLRHTFGTRLGEQGVPAHEIMYVMGHESILTSQRYLHAGDGRHERTRQATVAARMSGSL